MRRDTDQEKQKRSNMYTKAVEFFDKALQLDPKNAYAAQGIAIALVEDKKDIKTALSIFLKVRETVKDPGVFVNLGHVFAESRQYRKRLNITRLRFRKIVPTMLRFWLVLGEHGWLKENMRRACRHSRMLSSTLKRYVITVNLCRTVRLQLYRLSRLPLSKSTLSLTLLLCKFN